MFKKLISVFSVTLLLVACSSAPDPSEQAQIEAESSQANDALQVVTTFYPIYDFTTKIAGNEADVKNIVPPGIEPHDYEPTPREIQEAYESDLFIYNGAGVDPWVENVMQDLEENGVHVLNMSETVALLEGSGEAHEHEDEHEHEEEEKEDHEEHEGEEHEPGHEENEHEEGHENEHSEQGNEESEHEHDHGDLPYDPHFWLDPVLAQNQANAIKEALIELKPENKGTFEANASNLITQLTTLDQAYQSGLQNCIQDKAIVTHDAFRYLENRYGINLPFSGLSPDEEPSAKALTELADFEQNE